MSSANGKSGGPISRPPSLDPQGKQRFVRLSYAALFDSKISSGALRVYAALASYTDRGDICWPSVRTLASRLGKKRQAVQRSIRQLERRGYLRRIPRGGLKGSRSNTNMYHLIYPPVKKPAAPDSKPEIVFGWKAGNGKIVQFETINAWHDAVISAIDSTVDLENVRKARDANRLAIEALATAGFGKEVNSLIAAFEIKLGEREPE